MNKIEKLNTSDVLQAACSGNNIPLINKLNELVDALNSLTQFQQEGKAEEEQFRPLKDTSSYDSLRKPMIIRESQR